MLGSLIERNGGLNPGCQSQEAEKSSGAGPDLGWSLKAASILEGPCTQSRVFGWASHKDPAKTRSRVRPGPAQASLRLGCAISVVAPWGKPQFPECNAPLGGDRMMHVEALQWPSCIFTRRLRANCHQLYSKNAPGGRRRLLPAPHRRGGRARAARHERRHRPRRTPPSAMLDVTVSSQSIRFAYHLLIGLFCSHFCFVRN